MRIGEAAAALGLPTHVLRHWEDVGVLVPTRSSGGQRDYDDELVARGRLVLLLQHANLSLADVRRLSRSSGERMAQQLTVHRAELQEQMAALKRADDFLAHVLQCEHPIVSECPECSAFAADAATRPRARDRA